MARRRLRWLVLLIFATVAMTGIASAAPWASHHGSPTNEGVVDGTGPRENATIAWTLEIDGDVTSSPAVVDGVVYVGTFGAPYKGLRGRYASSNGSAGDEGRILALDAETGEPFWTTATASGVFGSPAVSDDTVYVASVGGTLYALDASTGSVDWTRRLEGTVLASPTVDDGRVFVGTRAVDAHALSHRDWPFYALDATDGSTVWRRPIPEGVFGTAAVHGDSVIVGGQNGTVHAFDVAAGDERWRYRTPNPPGAGPDTDPLLRFDGITSGPTVVDGTVVGGSYLGRIYGLDVDDGEERFRLSVGSSIASSPSVADGTVYVGDYGGTLSALSLPSGRTEWTFGADERISKSAPAVTADAVYVGSADGRVYAVDRASGDDLWTLATGDWVLSSPAVVDGHLYVAGLDRLYAVASGGDGPSVGDGPGPLPSTSIPGGTLSSTALPLDDGPVQEGNGDYDVNAERGAEDSGSGSSETPDATTEMESGNSDGPVADAHSDIASVTDGANGSDDEDGGRARDLAVEAWLAVVAALLGLLLARR